MIYKKSQNKKGFTLLFAVLVSIIVLSVGASIITIAMKQVVLSGIGRESQYAFYAANTGIECAIYWDFNDDVFADTDAESFGANVANARCAGIDLDENLIADDISENGVDYTTNQFSLTLDNDRCVDVLIKKELINTGGSLSVASTSIESRGYNTCDQNSPRRTERGLRISY